MANWNNPTLSSLYTDVLSNLKDRDTDSASLAESPTNPPVGYIRFNRSNSRFEEWNGSSWVVRAISLSGGGTGATNAADARTNLGIGTMGTQNSNNVSITGGTISGLSSLTVTGQINANGGIVGNLTGNASTATTANTANSVPNGVVTTGSYPDPSWIPSLSGSKLTGSVSASLLSGTINDDRLSTNILRRDASIAATQIAWAPDGGNFIISAGQTISLYLGSLSYSKLWEVGYGIGVPGVSTNCPVGVPGLYLVSSHVTLFSETTEATYRMRIFAGASAEQEDYIIGRNETYVSASHRYVVLAASGAFYFSSGTRQVGVKVYSSVSASIQSFSGQVNNAITIVRIW